MPATSARKPHLPVGLWLAVPPRPDMVDWRYCGGAVAQLGARLDGIEEVVGSNPIGSTNSSRSGPDTWVTQRT